MIFLPYRMDSEKRGLPVFTVLVCIVCSFIYWEQYRTDSNHENGVQQFCYEDLTKKDVSFLRHFSRAGSGNPCESLFSSIREASASNEKIEELAKKAKPMGIFSSKTADYDYIHNRLGALYKRYELAVPTNLTKKLSYDPKDLDLVKMITSTFSHGSIFHLLGNLLFFYIFAASVELVIGSFVYVLFIAATTIGTSLAYSYAMIGVEEALPTIGLSGVVMAAIAALGIMMPAARIRCFMWFLIYFKVFRVPALLLAVWYIGWDIFEMKQIGNDSHINYVAHVSGAGLGVLLGLFYSLFQKGKLREAALSVKS